jgi:hypothetical protein
MNKILKILKYLLIVFLSFIAVFQFWFIIKNEYWNRSDLISALVPLCFVIVILYRHWFTWVMGIAIIVYGILDVIYWGSFSATIAPMQFTESLSEFTKSIHWLATLLQMFPGLFYLIALVILLLPVIRRKYFME